MTAKPRARRRQSNDARLSATSLASGHWPTVRIGDVLTLINGRAFKPVEWKGSGTPIVRIQNLNNADAPFNYFDGDLPEKFAIDDGALLFAWSGTPGTSFGAHIWRRGRAWLNQHIFKVQFDEEQFDRRFLQLAINQNLAEYVRAAHGAAGLAHITKGRFENSRLPQPCLDEQRRIVEEIEMQLTRLSAGVGGLKRVLVSIRRYRSAVVRDACEGRLLVSPTLLQPEPVISQGVRGATPNRPALKRGNGTTAGIDSGGAASIPNGWVWTTLAAIADVKGGLTKDQKRRYHVPARLVPYLRVANVQRGFLDLEDVREILASEDDIRGLALKAGDILFNEGGDRDKLGRGWIWNEELPECVHQNHVFRARLRLDGVQPKFVSWYANSFGQRYFFDEGKHTTNLASLSMSKLKSLPIPLSR